MAIVLAAEIGTGSTKSLILRDGKYVGHASSFAYAPMTPFKGAARQRPGTWREAFADSVKNVCRGFSIKPRQIDCIVVGGQMHGFVPNGTGIANLWCDTTAADDARRLALTSGLDILLITGNNASPNLTAAKIMRMAQLDPEGFKRMKFWTLPAGSVLLWLIGEPVTDPSDASGTQLWDIKKRCWSREMFDAAGIPWESKPRLSESLEIAGKLTAKAAKALGLRPGIPVVAGGADQSEGAIGNGVIYKNMGLLSFIWGNSGVLTAALKTPDPDALLNTFAHGDGGVITFLCTCACGSAQDFWARMFGATSSEDMDNWAKVSPVGSNGVTFIPLHAGSRMLDNYDPNGTFLHVGLASDEKGLKRAKADLCRAIQEGILMEARMGLVVMRSKGIEAERIMFGGGGANSNHLAQMVADIFGLPVTVPDITETTALGAAIRGAVVMGDFNSIEEACKALVRPFRTFKPNKRRQAAYGRVFERFREDVEAVTGCKVR